MDPGSWLEDLLSEPRTNRPVLPGVGDALARLLDEMQRRRGQKALGLLFRDMERARNMQNPSPWLPEDLWAARFNRSPGVDSGPGDQVLLTPTARTLLRLFRPNPEKTRDPGFQVDVWRPRLESL